MAKTETIRARMEPDLMHKAESVLADLGLNPTAAITLFYKQVTLYQGLPFDVRLPNVTTREALRQSHAREDMNKYTSLDELKRKGRGGPSRA